MRWLGFAYLALLRGQRSRCALPHSLAAHGANEPHVGTSSSDTFLALDFFTPGDKTRRSSSSQASHARTSHLSRPSACPKVFSGSLLASRSKRNKRHSRVHASTRPPCLCKDNEDWRFANGDVPFAPLEPSIRYPIRPFSAAYCSAPIHTTWTTALDVHDFRLSASARHSKTMSVNDGETCRNEIWVPRP